MKRYIAILALSALPLMMAAQQQKQQFPAGPQHNLWHPGNTQHGQWNNQGRQQFSPEAFKKGLEQFVAANAGLTAQESQQFFPLLHEMLAKQREIQNKINANLRKGTGTKNEQDFEKLLNENAQLEIENNKIELNYYQKFHKVLSWEKIYKVKGALYLFNMEALKKFTPQRPPIGQWKAPGQQRQH